MRRLPSRARLGRNRATARLTNFAGETRGLVPEAEAGDDTKFLKGDGTWTGVTEYPNPLTTRGDLIFRDDQGDDARLALGTSGQVLSSDGSDPTWTTPIPRVLASGTVSNGASLDLALDTHSDITIFDLYVYQFLPATDAQNIWVRFSDDGGSTFEADASDYGWEAYRTDDGDDADAQINLTAVNISNTAGEVSCFKLTIVDPHSAAPTFVLADGYVWDDGGGNYKLLSAGIFYGTSPATDIQVLMSSGNIASCGYKLIGLA